MTYTKPPRTLPKKHTTSRTATSPNYSTPTRTSK